MENTIAALRANYFSVSIGLTILLLVALLSIQKSTGVIRGGDDEGSGIGGTGLIPSESGFGGTGLKPFLGMNESGTFNEVLAVPGSQQSSVTSISSRVDFSILQTTVQTTDVATEIESAPQVTAAQFETHNSSPIHITEAIQASLNEQAGYLAAEEKTSAGLPTATNISDNAFNSSESVVSVEKIETVNISRAAEALSSADPMFEARIEFPASETLASLSSSSVDSTNWHVLTNYLANESINANIDSNANLQRPATELRSAPTRKIQRPELPPIQRARPVERLSVLPPRIQPLGR